MIKAVIFDLDGTLLNRDASVKLFIEKQYERLFPFVGHIPKERYTSRFIELDNGGYVWKDKVYQQLVSEFDITGVTWEALLQDYENEFKYSCVPFTNLKPMLETLNKRNVLLGMITNGYGQFQLDNIKALGIEEYFDVILISEWEKVKKPDREIFQRAVERLQVLAHECVFVGDHPENDVFAAQKVGMTAIWKKDERWDGVEADFKVDDIGDIPSIVEEINKMVGKEEKIVEENVMKKIIDSWFTVTPIDEKTFAISEFGHWEKVHSFLLIGEEEAALIDTGLGIDNIKRITDQVTKLPIRVVTTHVHWDHIGSHGEFDSVYVHKEEEDWLVNGIKKLPIEQIRHDVSRDITKPTPASFQPETYTPFQGQPTGLLEDGDVIELGSRKLVICHTPGHSPGHISILDTSRGYLFTGDLLYDETPVYAFFPTTDPVQLVLSLEKIANLKNVTKIFGSHNTIGLEPSLLDEVKKAVQELKRQDVIKFGTGIHTFNGFSVQF